MSTYFATICIFVPMPTNMEVRQAKEEDIPHIVNLLKVSLGETLMPKSEQFWRWKHIDNPFGESPVLVCWENGVLIGVRAFMRWEWIMNGRIFRTVRAVDTATHPDHQGKGIFRKLTLSLVDKCEKEGVDFVFNTPNLKSKPGYLKMGWTEAGRLPIHISVQPINLFKHLVTGFNTSKEVHNGRDLEPLSRPDVEDILMPGMYASSKLVTHVTSKYLRWRYSDVPVAKYIALSEVKAGALSELLIARIKVSKAGCELRIVDRFGNTSKISREMEEQLHILKREVKSDYSTISGLCASPSVAGGIGLTVKRGPIVTVRPLAHKELEFLSNFNEWSPSIGDLELF